MSLLAVRKIGPDLKQLASPKRQRCQWLIAYRPIDRSITVLPSCSFVKRLGINRSTQKLLRQPTLVGRGPTGKQTTIQSFHNRGTISGRNFLLNAGRQLLRTLCDKGMVHRKERLLGDGCFGSRGRRRKRRSKIKRSQNWI